MKGSNVEPHAASDEAKAMSPRGLVEGQLSKYRPLHDWLQNQSTDQLTLSFDDIEDEDKIGVELPKSAREYRPWWGNEAKPGSRQCRAWLDAGWKVDAVDLSKEVVTFLRKKR